MSMRFRSVRFHQPWATAMGLLTVMLTVGVSGCEKPKIHAYRVPKPEKTIAPAPVPPARPQGVAWSVPESWVQVENPNPQRVATFKDKKGLEIAINAFPGDVGGLLANINRWRGQIGLEPTDQAALAQLTESMTSEAGAEVVIADIAGSENRLVGAIIKPGDGQSWFVKAIGDTQSIEQAKPEIIAFAKTFRLGQDSAQSNVNKPSQSDTNPHTEQWQPPAEWKVDPEASPILTAAFRADSGARITLTSLKGMGGGVLGNINRWRGQLGLEPVTSLAELSTTEPAPGILMIDLQSESNDDRIVAAILPLESQSLFFKLTGTNDQVDAEMERFTSFVLDVSSNRKGSP